jgi:hypothetical protein
MIRQKTLKGYSAWCPPTLYLRGAPKEGGCRAVASPPNPQNRNLKNTDFFRYYDIKIFTWFPLQLKSATEIS